MSAYACAPNAGSEPGIGWNWATHIAARGLDVTVLTTVENREAIEDELRERPLPDLHFHYVEMPTKRLREATGSHYFVWQWMALRKARELAARRPFDVVHHVTYGSVHVPTQLWRLGIPVVFGPVGGGQTTPPKLLRYFGNTIRQEQMRTVLTRLVRRSPLHRRWLKKMGAILVANTDTLELVSALGRPDAQIMFDTGISDAFRAPQSRVFTQTDPPLRILWVGRMLPRKALPLALDVLAQLKIPATLTIIGNGMEPALVWNLVKSHGLTGRVHWSGKRLPWADVRRAYTEHDVMLFNSLRESGGSQLVEAMALGLPIVTLNLHGPGDLVPDAAGIKVEAIRPDQLVSDLAAALELYASLPPERRSAMSAAGWRFTEELSHISRAEQAEILYRRLLMLPQNATDSVPSQVNPLGEKSGSTT